MALHIIDGNDKEPTNNNNDDGCKEKKCIYVHGDLCRRFPPIPIPVPAQNKITGEMTLGLKAAFPPLMTDCVCGEFIGDMIEKVPGEEIFKPQYNHQNTLKGLGDK